MANGNGTDNIALKNWKVAAPVSALGLLAMLAFQVGKDATIALEVGKQHGEEFVLIRKDIQQLKEDTKDRTKLRYYSTDADRDHRYLQRDIDACVILVKEHKKNDH